MSLVKKNFVRRCELVIMGDWLGDGLCCAGIAFGALAVLPASWGTSCRCAAQVAGYGNLGHPPDASTWPPDAYGNLELPRSWALRLLSRRGWLNFYKKILARGC